VLLPPFVPGMETAGVVRSAPDTSGLRVGERVSAFGVLGGYAERVAVPVANVVCSPAELNDAQAVSLLVNHNTMYFAALFSGVLGQLVSMGMKPPAPQHYQLAEAQAALQCLADGGVLGKLVLEP
jgi:D-arabinose 1-dehydrogenase-like Zn-dependent alcohol dehydrogenase